ncbi:MAG: F0F1 ATP synthase subunit delta [Candidatus Woesebacteria bacterium]|nr:MAG: F0F1 ATP synthase subunit delta [Candidatus Woesebacteria bacterium]
MQSDSLLKLVRTKEERIKLSSELKLLLDGLYKSGKNSFDSLIKSQIDKQTADILTNNFKKEVDREEYLKQSIKLLEDMDEIEVTISYKPSENTINSISEWISNNLKGNYAIDFKCDPEIIAGLTLTINGKFLDLSYKAKFEEYFNENITNLKKNLV